MLLDFYKDITYSTLHTVYIFIVIYYTVYPSHYICLCKMYVKQKRQQYVWRLDSHCSKCFARLVVWDSHASQMFF